MKGKIKTPLFAAVMTAGLLAAASALAQTSQSTSGSGGPAEVGELVVTGSRIPTANLTSIQPITTLTGENIQQRGFTNLADALNDLPTLLVNRIETVPATGAAVYGSDAIAGW